MLLPYIAAITYLYSWKKISPLASFNKRFSSLTYVLESSWSNRSSIALTIQSKDLKYVVRQWEITLTFRCCFSTKKFFYSYWHPYFSRQFWCIHIYFCCFLFCIFPEQMAFFACRHLLKCNNSMLCYCLSYRSLVQSNALRLSICLRRRIQSLNP